MNKTLFILGGAGFIGHEVVIQAVQAGWQVKALVRSEKGANKLRQVGARPVMGDVSQPEAWIAEVRGSTALIDLTQPKFPRRLSRSAIQSLSAVRQTMTRTMLEALQRLPAQERPIFFSVSGADDLQLDHSLVGILFWSLSNVLVFPNISRSIVELHKLARVVSDIRTNELERCRSNFVERCIEPAYGREKFRIIVKVLGKSIAPSGISLPIPRFKKAFRLFKELQHSIISEIS